MINREQIEFWNGQRGESWVAEQAVRDRSLAPFGEAALEAARPRPGERVVDIGCGCGTTTLALAAAVGRGGVVLGIDVSTPMLGRARERAAALAQVRLERADAATFAFDGLSTLLFSRFGVMFFDDPQAAFSNLRQALAPGGRLVFVCWRALEDNAWLAVPWLAVRESLPELPPPAFDRPGPLSLAEPRRVRGILEAAGFSDVTLERLDHAMPLGDGQGLDAAAAEAITLGPTARLLASVDDAARARALASVRAALSPHAKGGDVQLSGGAWLVRAA